MKGGPKDLGNGVSNGAGMIIPLRTGRTLLNAMETVDRGQVWQGMPLKASAEAARTGGPRGFAAQT